MEIADVEVSHVIVCIRHLIGHPEKIDESSTQLPKQHKLRQKPVDIVFTRIIIIINKNRGCIVDRI